MTEPQIAQTTVEWIVQCGSASMAPCPRFDNEAEAFARYREEIVIPSYFGPGHRRRASVVKVTTMIENVTPDKTEAEMPRDEMLAWLRDGHA